MLSAEQFLGVKPFLSTTQRGDITMSISSPTPSTEEGQIYQNFIGGEWHNSRSGETFVSTNPAHISEVIGRYQKSTAADIEDAVEAAVKAQSGWATIPAPERGEILLRAALLLEQQKEDPPQ